MKLLFNIEPHLTLRKYQKTLYTRISSKKIFHILEEIGMPKGRKTNLMIPAWIKDNPEHFITFIKGLFDTDGSVIIRKRGQHSVSLSLKNKEIILDIKLFLEKLGYFVSYYEDNQQDKRGFSSTVYCIRINRKSLIKKFWREIGSSNPYKIKRFEKLARSGDAGI